MSPGSSTTPEPWESLGILDGIPAIPPYPEMKRGMQRIQEKLARVLDAETPPGRGQGGNCPPVAPCCRVLAAKPIGRY